MHRWLPNPRALILAPLMLLLILAVACGTDATPTPVVIEKEVIKEVEVPVEVEKEVIKEVEVTREVVKEVIKEVEKEVVKEVEVTKEVVKEVIKEVEKEVVKEVEVVATPTAAPPTPTLRPTATPTIAPRVTPTPTPAPVTGPVEAKVDLVKIFTDPVSTQTNLGFGQTSSSANNQARHMMETLVGVNPETALHEPHLATEWEMSPDGRTWTIKLRKNVPFHFGWGDFSSADLRLIFDQIVAEDSVATDRSTWKPIIGETKEELDQSIEIIDANTVRFNLISPSADMEFFLSARQGNTFMHSTAQFEAEGIEGLEKAPAGTNSYMFKERVLGQYLEFEAVDNHWRRTPDFKGLRISYSREPSTRLAALLTGEAHMVTLPRSLYGQARQNGMAIVSSSVPGNQVIQGFGGFYHPDSPEFDPTVPFHDIRVRRAINHAINREEMIEELFGGDAEILYVHGYHPTMPGWKEEWRTRFDELYGYDPEKARQLLAEVGYGPDNPMKVKSLITELAQLPEMGEIGETMVIYLEDVGIEVEEVELDFSTAISRIFNKDMHNIISNLPQALIPAQQAIKTFNLALELGRVYYSEDDVVTEAWVEFMASVDPVRRLELLEVMGDQKYFAYLEMPLVLLPSQMLVDPNIVADWTFPGNHAGTYTHVEYIEAVPK